MAETFVVVVNYASSDLLVRGLGPLSGNSNDLRVIVVDNYSTARERDRLVELSAENGWQTVLEDGNRGFGAGVNRGAAVAVAQGASTLAIINPDARITPDDLELLVARCAEQPWALYSPTVVKENGATWFDGAVLDLDEGRTMSLRRAARIGPRRTMPWLSGAVLVTSAALWQELQGFDEEYFLYWEDVDLSARALRVGAELVVDPQVTAVHAEGGTQQGDTDRAVPWTRSEAYYYYNIRNRLLFAARNLDPQQAQQWADSAWRAAYQTLLIGGRRKFLRPAMPLRAAWRGVRDGRSFVTRSNAAQGRRAGVLGR